MKLLSIPIAVHNKRVISPHERGEQGWEGEVVSSGSPRRESNLAVCCESMLKAT